MADALCVSILHTSQCIGYFDRSKSQLFDYLRLLRNREIGILFFITNTQHGIGYEATYTTLPHLIDQIFRSQSTKFCMVTEISATMSLSFL